MTFGADILANLAANLAADLVGRLAGRPRDLAFGDAETRALRQVWEYAIQDMLGVVTENLDVEVQDTLEDVMRAFVATEGVGDALLDLALEGREPPLTQLQTQFDALEFDRATLPVEFDTVLAALTRGLTQALLTEAQLLDSPLFNRVSLVRTAAIHTLLQEQKETMAAVAATVSRLEQGLPGTPKYQIVFFGPVSGVAQGDAASVEIASDLRPLLKQIERLIVELSSKHQPESDFGDHIYDFTESIQSTTRWFVGRDFVFDVVDHFLERRPCGYLRIEAEAGLGKTAIAAELTKRYSAIAHFFNASEGITRPEQCLNDLCAKLIAHYGLKHMAFPANAGENAVFFSSVLREATQQLAREKPLVIVIDALDEADPTPAGHNWLHLPSCLPNRSYVILTHRPGNYPLAIDANTSEEKLGITWNDPRQQADIQAYLQRQATERAEIRHALERAEPPISRERFVNTLQASSEGNFMYLDYVLSDIAAREPGFDPLCLDDLPRGLTGYYEQFWAQMSQARDQEGWTQWNGFYRPIIALLGVVGGPMSAAWFAAHTGGDPHEIRERALLRWQHFLRSTGQEGRERWSIIHQSFRDFLERKLGGLESTHAQVANYYLDSPIRWREHENYALRYLSAHLVASGQSEELGNLIQDPAWFRAQCTYDPTRRSYLSDVTKALASAMAQGLDGLPLVLASGLLRGTIATRGYELTREEIMDMVTHRQIDAILLRAEMLPRRDWFRLDLLQLAGEVAELAGQRDRAIHELRNAVGQVVDLPSHMMSKYLESLARDLLRLNDQEGIELALGIAKQIPPHPMDRRSETVDALREISEQIQRKEPEAGIELDLSEYLAVARLNSDNYTKRPPKRILFASEESSLAWAKWAEILNECEHLDRAHEAFAQAKAAANLMRWEQYQYERTRVLGKLAEVAAGIGRPNAEIDQLLDEAAAATELQPHYIPQIVAWIFLANLSMALGHTGRARQLLGSIWNEFRRERPQMMRQATWLVELAPCASLLTEPTQELAHWIADEVLRQIVAGIWQMYAGDATQAQALLAALDKIKDFAGTNTELILYTFRAMVPVLKAQPASSQLLMQALAVSRKSIQSVFTWLDWLSDVLPVVEIDDEFSRTLWRDLQLMHSQAAPEEQIRLALHLAPPLARLPVLDSNWAISLIHQFFSQSEPYHRASALEAVERFAPLVLALAGPETTAEAWDHMQAVERLFQ